MRFPERIDRFWRHTAYLLADWAILLGVFVLVLTGLATGVGTMLIVLGPIILAATLKKSTAAARLEAEMQRSLLGITLPPITDPTPTARESVLRRSIATLKDRQAWLRVPFALMGWTVALLTFVTVLTWWGLSLGVTTPIWGWYLTDHGGFRGIGKLLGLGDSVATDIALSTAIGIVFLMTLPVVTRALARAQSTVLGAMITHPMLQAEVTKLTDSSRAAHEAEVGALQRLERDIHDGPQQGLVRITMDLARADKQFDTDPAAARATVAQTLRTTRDTLDELRNLSRGIAPPLLVDRGLSATLSDIVDRSAVHASLRVDPAIDRLPPPIAHAIYYVVSEALTNVAKHSGASQASVRVEREAGMVSVTVVDDGRGGADVTRGSGLRGLSRRIEGLRGTLYLNSPVGGPTTVMGQIPCV